MDCSPYIWWSLDQSASVNEPITLMVSAKFWLRRPRLKLPFSYDAYQVTMFQSLSGYTTRSALEERADKRATNETTINKSQIECHIQNFRITWHLLTCNYFQWRQFPYSVEISMHELTLKLTFRLDRNEQNTHLVLWLTLRICFTWRHLRNQEEKHNPWNVHYQRSESYVEKNCLSRVIIGDNIGLI